MCLLEDDANGMRGLPITVIKKKASVAEAKNKPSCSPKTNSKGPAIPSRELDIANESFPDRDHIWTATLPPFLQPRRYPACPHTPMRGEFITGKKVWSTHSCSSSCASQTNGLGASTTGATSSAEERTAGSPRVPADRRREKQVVSIGILTDDDPEDRPLVAGWQVLVSRVFKVVAGTRRRRWTRTTSGTTGSSARARGDGVS